MWLTSEFIEFGSTYNNIVAGGAESKLDTKNIMRQGWILQCFDLRQIVGSWRWGWQRWCWYNGFTLHPWVSVRFGNILYEVLITDLTLVPWVSVCCGNILYEVLIRDRTWKIPSEMEVAPRYNCWNCWQCWQCWHCWHCSTLFDTVDMTYNELSFHTHLSCSNFPIGPAVGWNALRKVTVTWMSRSIFILTVQEGVQEYFLIHCRTRVSKSIF